jgi:hypothetical protein
MFNKIKCKKCKYSMNISGFYSSKVFCNYCEIKNETCIKRDGTDIRGNNPNKCLLYEKKLI